MGKLGRAERGMRHRTPVLEDSPSRQSAPRNVVRLFRRREFIRVVNLGYRRPGPRGRVPGGYNRRRQLATGRPEQMQGRATQCPERRYLRITRSGAGRKSRRAACFRYFLSRRKKVLPPSGRQPHHPRAGVGASISRRGMRLKGFPARLLKPFDTKSGQKPTKTAFLALSAKWPRIAIDWEVLRRKPSSRPALSCTLPVGVP